MMRALAAILALAGTAAADLSAEAPGGAKEDDWPAWRGPAGNGVSEEKKAPATWGPDKNVKWKAPLPQWGNGSPVVSKGRVFVTSAEDAGGLKRSLLCFDRKDGKQLWKAAVDFGRKEATHNTNGYCPTTPAADGERVVVWHGSAGLHCYDFEGKKLWSRELGDFPHMWGDGTSPVLHEGRVILIAGPGKNFVTSLDAKTGKTVWQVEEASKGGADKNEKGGYLGTWATPLVVKVGGKDQIVCALPTRVVAYDPKSGQPIWWVMGVQHDNGAHDLAYSSPVVAGNVLVYVGGFGGPGLGAPLGGRGDVTPSRLWRIPKCPQSIGSGVALDGVVYMPFENSLQCLDPKTGKTLWQDRGTGGGYWGSIVSAAGRLYVTGQDGTTVVFKPDPQKFELVSANALNEKSNSTPAISDGEIFIRTFKHLWCIAE
jgi:outer membrane protein assembly factor BamB